MDNYSRFPGHCATECGASDNLFTKRYTINATREQYDAVVRVLIGNSDVLRKYITDLRQFNGVEGVQQNLSYSCSFGEGGGVTAEIVNMGDDKVQIIVYASRTQPSGRRTENKM